MEKAIGKRICGAERNKKAERKTKQSLFGKTGWFLLVKLFERNREKEQSGKRTGAMRVCVWL